MTTRELTPELKALAKKDLGEDEHLLKENIEHILEWLKKQPHLNVRTDPQWIAAFLRGCKHSLERTKQKIDAFYTVRSHLPELFADRDPKGAKINELLDLGILLPLPATPDPTSPRIMIIRGGRFDPNKFHYLDTMHVNYMLMDIMLLEDDRLTIAGQKTILDLSSSRFEHLAQFTPATVKKTVACFQDAYPLRPKGIHFLNVPSTFDTIYNIFKLFIKDKLKNRIMVHSDVNALYEHIPREILPKDLGGNGPSFDELTVQWKNKALEYREWLMEDAKFRVDESKRVGKRVSDEDLFGVEGSFKKLNID